MNLAELIGTQGTCPRAQVGAILVHEDRIIGTGYNGSPRLTPHCKTDGCWLYTKKDKKSCFRAVHAEINAIANAAYGGVATKDSVLFCTHSPCYACLQLIINAGIRSVYYRIPYADKLSNALAKQANIFVCQFSSSIPPKGVSHERLKRI